MSPAEAFRLGFLQRCLVDGADPAAAAEKAASLVAAAEAALTVKTADLLGSAGGLASSAAGWMIPLGLAAPWVAGGALGYGAGRLADVDDRDVDEAKSKELTDELRRQTAILQQNRLARAVQARAGHKHLARPAASPALPTVAGAA